MLNVPPTIADHGQVFAGMQAKASRSSNMHAKLVWGLVFSVAATLIASPALGARPSKLRGPMDARTPTEAQGVVCVDRPGASMALAAGLFARLKAYGGSDAAWTGLGERSAKAKLLSSLDAKGLADAGFDPDSDVCFFVFEDGVGAVIGVSNPQKAWDSALRFASLWVEETATPAPAGGKGNKGKPKKAKPGAPPLGRPHRVEQGITGLTLLVEDGVLIVSTQGKLLGALRRPPRTSSSLLEAMPSIQGRRLLHFAFSSTKDGPRVPVGGAWVLQEGGSRLLVQGVVPPEVAELVGASAPTAEDQRALAEGAAAYAPARSHVTFLSFGLEGLVAALSKQGDVTEAMPKLGRHLLKGLRGSLALIVTDRLVDTRIVVPIRDATHAKGFVEGLLAELKGKAELEVHITARTEGSRTETRVVLRSRDKDLDFFEVPIVVVQEPGRVVVGLADAPRAEAQPRPIPPPPAGGLLGLETPPRFAGVDLLVIAAALQPFSRGALREGLSWLQALSLFDAEQAGGRMDLRLKGTRAELDVLMRHGPIPEAGQPGLYREALRAAFQGDRTRFGEGLAKTLAAGPSTQWGTRAHAELYAPSALMAMYTYMGMMGVIAVPTFMKYVGAARSAGQAPQPHDGVEPVPGDEPPPEPLLVE